MKYTVQVTINKNRNEVVSTIRSVEDAYQWMKGLKSFELIEGKNEEKDSKYEMVFENKGKKQVMIETMTEFNPPKQITTVYEMSGVWNECVNRFEEVEENKTIYYMDNTFKFPFLMRLFMWMFKPMFKKQTLSSMLDLKKHIESK